MQLVHQVMKLLFVTLSNGSEQALLDTAASSTNLIIWVSAVSKQCSDMLVAGFRQQTGNIVVERVFVFFKPATGVVFNLCRVVGKDKACTKSRRAVLGSLLPPRES